MTKHLVAAAFLHEAWKAREARWQASMDTILRVVEQVQDDQRAKADAGVGGGLPPRAQPDAASSSPQVWRRRK